MDANHLDRPGLYVAHQIISAILNFHAIHLQQSSTKPPTTPNEAEMQQQLDTVIKEEAARSLALFFTSGIDKTAEILLRICHIEVLRKTQKTIIGYLLDSETDAHDRLKYFNGFLEFELHWLVETSVDAQQNQIRGILFKNMAPTEPTLSYQPLRV